VRRPGLSLVAVAVAALVLPRAASAVTGAEVIERMQERFQKAKTYEAHFEKQFYWAILDKHLSRQGHIYTRRPGQFRVQVEDGDLVVADGDAIWAYSKANEQVVVSRYQGELHTPWEILVEYAASYQPLAVEETEAGGRKVYLLTLQPTDDVPAALRLQRMRLWVERKDWHLLRVEQVEANDDVSTYILSGHRTNEKLDDELFQFSPPDGTEIIDRRTPDP
jgi:chaperone LolA